MKRKWWIILALATLITVLGCGAAMAADEYVHGTVYTSQFVEGRSLVLTDNTILVVDEDRMLESIIGESYTLTLQGTRNLTLNPINYGISVKKFVSTSTGSLTINHDAVGINSLSTLTITGTAVYLVLPEADNRSNLHIGIRAEGDININAAISIPNPGEYIKA